MRLGLALLIVVLMCAGCHEPEAASLDVEAQSPAESISLVAVGTDGVTVKQPDLSRIVTLGGPATELVYALGFGDRVVGTDRSSVYPAEVMQKTRLSYLRESSAESILSLEPTLVIAEDVLGPPAVIGQLRAAGVPVLLVREAETLADAEQRVQTVGAVLGKSDEAEALIARMRSDLAEAEALHPDEAPRVLFVYARGTGLVQIAGSGGAAELVLQLAGAENAVTAFEGFRPLTAEAAVEAAPDVIVIPERGLESIDGIDGLLRQPGLAQTPAGQNRRVVAVDDALLLGLGPRMGEGVAALARALQADAPTTATP